MPLVHLWLAVWTSQAFKLTKHPRSKTQACSRSSGSGEDHLLPPHLTRRVTQSVSAPEFRLVCQRVCLCVGGGLCFVCAAVLTVRCLGKWVSEDHSKEADLKTRQCVHKSLSNSQSILILLRIVFLTAEPHPCVTTLWSVWMSRMCGNYSFFSVLWNNDGFH